MLKELRNQHRTIIQMVFSGFKNNEIAERLEMSACTVSQIIRSPLGQAYLEGLQDKAKEATLDVRKQLVSLNRGALNTLERLLNPAEKAPHSVQLASAKDVLDRTGYKAPDKLHVDMTMQTKTDQEIDAEINAMQASISKTYLVDPNESPIIETELQSQTELQSSPEVFTDEQPNENPTSIDTFELNQAIDSALATNTDLLSNAELSPNVDSSGQFVNSSGQFVNSPKGRDKHFDSLEPDEHVNSPTTSTPEESLHITKINKSIIDQIPADLFKNS